MAPEDVDDQAPDEMGDEEEAEVDEKEELSPMPRRRAPHSPVREGPKRDKGEITAMGAFSTSFVFLALILAPTMGLIMYFLRYIDAVLAFFETSEGCFLGGMGIGIAAAFAGAVVFTYKAMQHD
jgi:hypothetical protein